jgi:hypothetical protein
MEKIVLRRKIIIALLLLYLFIVFLLVIPISIADLSKPQTTIGDYWNYSGNYMGTTATCNVLITERKNITIDNEVYDVFVSVATVKGIGPRNASLHRIETAYIRVLDGAIVKITDYFNYSSDDLIQIAEYEYLYSSPLDMMQYPISLGEKWDNNYSLKTIDILSGNTTDTQVSEFFECEKTTTEFEMNKTFECYVVKKTEYIEDQRYDTRYYLSEETGSEPVKLLVEYNGSNLVLLKIISYNLVSTKELEDKIEETPGFELILLIFVIAIVIYLKQKNRFFE